LLVVSIRNYELKTNCLNFFVAQEFKIILAHKTNFFNLKYSIFMDSAARGDIIAHHQERLNCNYSFWFY